MSSRCDQLEPLHSAWVDGELGAVDRARLASHLQRCGRCRAAVHGLRVTQSMLRSLPTHTLPIAVARDAEAPTSHRRRTAASVRRAATRSTTVALAIAVVLAAAGFVAGSTDEPEPSIAVPVDIYVADHLVRSVGGPVSTPAMAEAKP